MLYCAEDLKYLSAAQGDVLRAKYEALSRSIRSFASKLRSPR